MTATPQRLRLIALIEAACRAGARVRKACELVGLSVRTLERWRVPLQPLQPLQLLQPLQPLQPLQLETQPKVQPQTPQEALPAPILAPLADRRVAGLRRPFTPHNKLSPTGRWRAP